MRDVFPVVPGDDEFLDAPAQLKKDTSPEASPQTPSTSTYPSPQKTEQIGGVKNLTLRKFVESSGHDAEIELI
jgi:hypothetical protein